MNTPNTARSGGAGAGDVAPRTLQSELFDVIGLVTALWRRRALIAVAALVGAALAFLALRTVPPTYTAEARVLLDTRDSQVIDINNVLSEPVFGTPAILSEIALIESAAILEPTAEFLDLPRHPEFNPEIRTPSLVGRAIEAARALVRGRSSEGEERSPYAIAADQLLEQVRVSQLGESFTLRIEASTGDPGLSAQIANAIATTYLDYRVGVNREAARQATTWLETRVIELRQRLADAETLVEQARADGMSDSGVSTQVIQRQIDDMSSRLVDARVAYADAVARRDSFVMLAAEGNMGAAMQIASSAQLQRLIERRLNTEQQRLTMTRRGESVGVSAESATSPTAALPVEPNLEQRQLDETLRVIDASIRIEAAEIERSLAASVNIAQQSLREQEAQLGRLESAIAARSKQVLRLRSVEREAEAIRATYLQFLNRLIAARERGDFQEPNARVVAEAVAPQRPSAPNKPATMVLGFILAGGVAATAVIALDVRSAILRSPASGAEAAGAPLLATLPPLAERARGGGAAARALMTPSDWMTGQLRRIHALVDESDDGACRLVLFAGVDGSEDATALAILLAREFVRAGVRTAFVVSKRESEGPLKPLIEACLSEPGGGATVMVLDPASRGRARIEALSASHDRIVVAAGAVCEQSDGLIAGRGAEMGVLVLRLGQTSQPSLAAARGEFERFRVRLGGVVVIDPAIRGLARPA